jgi:hypothetical protein
MTDTVSIRVPRDLLKLLNELKVHPREPYYDVIMRVVREWMEMKRSSKA